MLQPSCTLVYVISHLYTPSSSAVILSITKNPKVEFGSVLQYDLSKKKNIHYLHAIYILELTNCIVCKIENIPTHLL